MWSQTKKRKPKDHLKSAIELVGNAKSSDTNVNDVIKTSANFDGVRTNYNEAYRALTASDAKQNKHEIKSYELIIPYLQKLKEKNENSVLAYKRLADKSISQIFFCPGFSNENLYRVRPVLSADACHLRSKYQGTLFLATVKSGNNELIPIALCITADNESYAGWKFFFSNLKKSCPCIELPYPDAKYNYKYFTIVSDREKGLIRAFNENFPENHHTHCTIHIARNVQKNFGAVASRIVLKIAKTYSTIEEAELLEELKQVKPEALDYILNIDKSVWRSTAWAESNILPPRFGITDSNMSESLNSMIDDTRNGPWLDTILGIIKKMIQRTAHYKEIYKKQSGIIPWVEELVQKRYKNCAGFQVIQMNNPAEFFVTRSVQKHGDREIFHTVEINERTCSCGKWQDMQIPCIDAVAVFRVAKNICCEDIVRDNVPNFYHLEKHEAIFQHNMEPVVIDTIRPDGETLPPTIGSKRQPGAPKIQRLRFRHPKTKVKSNKNIVQPKAKCKICGALGHYAKTCETRKKKKNEKEEDKTIDLA